MEKVFPIREERKAQIPAVTHVDGSGRLQSVYQDVTPRYHALISAFHAKSGVPILLNTSFQRKRAHRQRARARLRLLRPHIDGHARDGELRGPTQLNSYLVH